MRKILSFFVISFLLVQNIYAYYYDGYTYINGTKIFYKTAIAGYSVRIVSEYEPTNTSSSISAYYSDQPTGSLIIPEYIGSLRVTSIGEYAFSCCTGLTSITIPSSVTSIGRDAFFGCYGLANVTLPNSVISIGSNAFCGCSGLTEVTLPNSINSIAYGVFNNCARLTSIFIPESVTSIGESAFYGCGLTSITLPSSVSTIGRDAFRFCPLSEITSMAIIAPTLTFGCVFGCDTSSIPVHIPCGSLDSYTNEWSRFTNFIEGFFNFDISSNDEAIGTVEILNTPLSCSNATANILATPTDGYVFSHWSDGTTSNPYNLTITQDTTIIGYFVEAAAVSLSVNSPSMGSASGNGIYAIGEDVNISASSSYGYHFTHWNDGNTDNPRTITLTQDTSFTAFFEPNRYVIVGVSEDENKGIVEGGAPVGSIPNDIIANGTMTNQYVPVYGLWADEYLRCQIIYPESMMTDLVGKEIQGISYYLFQPAAEAWTGTFEVKIGTVSNSTFGGTEWVDVSSFRTVYTGPLDATNSEMTINFASSYVYTGGNLLIETNQIVPSNYKSCYFYGITSEGSSLQNYNAVDWDSIVGIQRDFIPKTRFISPIDDSEAVDYLSEVNLTATANYGYHFDHWNDGNTDNPRTVMATSNVIYTAYFSPNQYTLSVNSSDNTQGNVSGAGDFDYLSEPTIVATANYGYYFDHWSDGRTDNPYQLILTQDTTLIAYFVSGRTITVMSEDEDKGSVSGGGVYPPNGSTAEISATANYGYHFDHWNDGNTDNPRTISVTGNDTYTAYFAPNQYELSIISNNSSQGNVSGSGSYNYLSEQTISANANYGYHFDHWNDGNTDNPRTVTVTGDATYTAYFALNQYTITVNCNNTSQGYVSGGGSYDYLSERTLTATAFYGYHFAHWNDGNTSSQRTITLTQDTTFTAFFEVNQYSLTLYSNDESLGTVSGGGIFNYLDTAIISASVIAPHHHFVRWSDGYTDNPRRCVITGNKTLYATFAIDEHTVSVAVDDIAHGSVQASGTTFNYGCPCTVTATAYSGYTFSGWSNGMTDNPYTFAVLNDVDLIAYFVPTGSQPTTYYTITTVSADPSMGSVTGGGSYASGTTATLTASANNGYHFTRWQDNITSNPRTITVTGNATYTAYFESDGGGEQPSDNVPSIACVGVDMNGHNVVRWEPRQGVAVVRYNIYREGLGGYSQVGFVNATNATEYSWVDDNSNTATQAYSYKISEVSASGTESDLSLPHTTMHLQISQGQGTTWNLSWTPYVGFNYSGYRIYRGTSSASMSLLTELSSSATTYSDNAPSGDVYYQIEVVASGAKSITASSRSNIATSVQNQQFTITVLSDNSSMGTVSGGGTFAEGTTTTISATPLSGYTFSQWIDGSTQAQRTITVTGNATYTAYFTAGGSETQQYLITVVSNNPDRGTVSGGGLYDAGAVITITAEPFAGFEFVQWQDGNTNDFRAITVTADATYTAYFRTATEGINDVKTTDNLKIYTRGNIIVIDFSGQQVADSRQCVVVYDVMGRVIKQAADSGQQTAVEIPVTAAGVYMVKVGDQPSRKVVVRP